MDVEWSIGRTHDTGMRGPEFDSHFFGILTHLVSDNRLKNEWMHCVTCNVMLEKGNKCTMYLRHLAYSSWITTFQKCSDMFIWIIVLKLLIKNVKLSHFCLIQNGDCWDVRQCFVWQFKTDYVRLIEGLVFEKKKFFLVTDKLKKLNFFL